MDPANLTLAQFRPIIFEGRILPRSVMGISLLANLARKSDRELAGWLATFPDCRDVTRAAPSLICHTLAGRGRDLMLDYRAQVLLLLDEHLATSDADAKTIYGEWVTALQQITELAAQTEDDCEWYAPANPDDAPIISKQIQAMRRHMTGGE